MSSAEESLVHLSSIDDLVAFLDTELDTDNGGEDDNDSDLKRVKRCKIELSEDVINPQGSSSLGDPTPISAKKKTCAHSGACGGLCFDCGGIKDDKKSGISLRYIHKDLWLPNDAIDRLRDKNLKNLLSDRKLCLVLDLDHTLLNSTLVASITAEEGYLNCERDALPDNLKSSLFRVDQVHRMTKLRPYVHTFLKEANKLFEMYIYTMGGRLYAMEMAKLLDPENIYFHSRIITRDDCTNKDQKSLDVVLAKESAIVILDDREEVWSKHKENLILVQRYHFFASSCKKHGFKDKSFSQQRSDESETKAALPYILKTLQHIHSLFFDPGRKDSLEERDLRQVLKSVRKQVLKDCRIVLSRFLLLNSRKRHFLWEMAEKLGAKCCEEVDSSVTHVVSMHAQKDESLWAVKEKKFLVHPCWLYACNNMWQKMPEEYFPIIPPKEPNYS